MPLLHPWLPSDPETGSVVDDPASPLPCEWLFAASNEPVLIVLADSGTIIHANPAAARLLSVARSELDGMKLIALLDSASSEKLLHSLDKAESIGHSAAQMLRTADGKIVSIALSLVRIPPQSYILVRMTETGSLEPAVDQCSPKSAVFESIDAAPMAFLITDANFQIDYANRAFIGLIGVESQSALRGKSLLNWIHMTAADLARLADRLSQRKPAELVKTAIHPEDGRPCPVEVCAVPVPDGADTRWGLTVRVLPQLN